MGEIGICGIDNRVSLFFPEWLDTDNSISGLILSNNLLYNLYYFVWDLVCFKKSFSSKIVCVEQKMIFSCVYGT